MEDKETDGGSCCHDGICKPENQNQKSEKIPGITWPVKRIAVFAAAFILWILGLVLTHLNPGILAAGQENSIYLHYIPLLPFLAAWLLAGLPVLRNAIRNFFPSKGNGFSLGRAFDENFLMSIATIGAFAIGEWEEAAGVMIFYMIGELIQEAAIGKSRASIDALLALKPDKARIQDGDDWKEIAAADVNPGSLVLVRPGERIPLDGIIENGESSVDVSMLTGESRPALYTEGDEVRSGTVSLNGVLRIRTTKSAGDSSAARIIELVQSARKNKAMPERFITAFARWYTPLVVSGAVLMAVLPPLFIPNARFADWFYRALILLVISCPCALVVSIPLGYFAGIGGMSRRGIIVKGAVYLDSLNRTKNVAFDKTGTLTRGKFSITALEPAAGVSEQTLIKTAVLAEQESNHPIARAIIEYAEMMNEGSGIMVEEQKQVSVSEIAGMGLEVLSGKGKILAGNRRLLESRGIGMPSINTAGLDETGAHTPVYIACDEKYLGRILIGDTLKDGAIEAISRLKTLGIQSTMFTGDTFPSAIDAASRLGINSVEAELLPEDKLEKVDILTHSGITVFVGDGINDAPVLARSHVGIAMGSGADAAVEAADVVVMTDDPRRVPEAIERARKTHRIIIGNVIFALGAKGIFIILAGLGMANMWVALIADVGVALAAILNSTRALR